MCNSPKRAFDRCRDLSSQVSPRATIFRVTKKRWAQIGITTEFLIVVRTLGEFFRLRHVHGTNFSTAVAALYVGGALNRGLLLLGGRDLVLLPTLYAVRLDYASHRTRSAGIQNCRDWSVVSSRSADSVETRADQAGQLSGMAIYHQSAGANQVAILTVELDGCTTHSVGERDRGQLAGSNAE